MLLTLFAAFRYHASPARLEPRALPAFRLNTT